MLRPVLRSWPGSEARSVVLACLVLLGGATAADALTLHHTYRFDADRLELGSSAGTAAVRAEGAPSTWVAGRPEIPYEIVTLLVPRGSCPLAVRAYAPAERLVAEGLALAAAAPLADDLGRLLAPKPEAPALGPAASAPSGSYPAERAEVAGGGALHGYQLLSVRVYPVRYETATGRLFVAERIDLELDLAPGGAMPLERQRYSAEIEAMASKTLQDLVANPQALAGYSRRIGSFVGKPEGGFQPTSAPSLEGSAVDYIIITNEALSASWQVLADWKSRRGVPTVVRSVEWIQASYRRGSDLQETIRTFIRDAYAKWGIRYVLLGGDTDVLPARFGFSAFGEPTERNIPSDMYFACLDGNWNRDGDALWGEAAINASDPGDSTDMYAEVFVGRATASTPAKVAAFVNKLLAYENPTLTAYQNKVLLLGEVLFPVDWDSGMTISMDGGTFCEELAAYATGCVTLKKLYENYWSFPGSMALTFQNTINEMNSGYGLVNHIGHGYRYNMSCGDRSLQNNHATALTNGGQRFVLYFLNCTATAFDFPCLAEAFLEASGGAVAVLGASRAAYALPSRNYNRGFFQAVYQNGYKNIGQAFVQSRLAQTPNAWFDTADHYSHLLYNFLGDPEMVMHTCALGTTAASYVAGIGLGLTNVIVTVTVGGSPRQGALVCLQKGTEEYEFGVTDINGQVTLPFRAESAGTVTVTVSGQNMTTHLGSINVTTGSVAYVSTQSLSINDTTGGGVTGNGDGKLDAGETLRLNVTFRNSGSQTATGTTGVLRIPSSWATVVDSTYALGTVAAGATANTTALRFTVAPTTPAGAVLPLTFVTTSGASTWTDVVNKVVHAPRMQLMRTVVDDYAPGGNGDGRIQAGETFDLIPYFKNFGTGAADGLAGALSTSDPEITILSGAISLGRANPVTEVTGTTRFRLQESTVDENILTLQLTDSHARVTAWNITLRGPAVPATPTLDASTGADVVIVKWTPSTDSDLSGYHVYRALSASGPWTQTTIDPTARVAYFRNTGLSPSTRYYFRVTALDTSGNESTPSPSASINTNPAQLAGWPIGLAASSSCPVVVGDITGDGSKEIIAGNDNLYAWSWNGLELRDDDGNPQTWGVFVSEIRVITGAVALAELDPSSPGLEIFVTSWEDSNKAFAVRGDGTFLPGWPRKPHPTSSPRGYWAASAAVDVNGDGRAELFASAKNGNLYAWQWNGTPFGAADAWKSGFGTWSRCSPTFANLDGDPELEIVWGAPNGTLQIWNADGSSLPNFPKSPGTLCLSNTAIGDINRDGFLDVVFINEGGAVNIYSTHTGNQLPGWPQSLSVKSSAVSPSPALADFNFDGFLEIVVASNHAVQSQSGIRVYNHLGQVLSGWPIVTGGYTSESSPIVADVSGDGVPDILFGNEGGLLYGWNFAGQELQGFPLSVGDFIRSTPFADDVDGDGDIDLVLAGWDKNVYIWDFPAPYVRTAAQWPTLKHDVARSGFYRYRIDEATDAGQDAEPGPAAAPARAFLAQNVPNPFNPVTSIQYGVPPQPGGGRVPVRIDILDVRGRVVRRLVGGEQMPGTYKALWDGRDDAGARAGSGIFFYRLQVAGETLARKMLLLK